MTSHNATNEAGIFDATVFTATAKAVMKGLLAATAVGAFFATATGASAKDRPHNTHNIAQVYGRAIFTDDPRLTDAFASVPARTPRNLPGGMYDSLSGGRHFYPNPDRDFAGAGDRNFSGGGAESPH